MASFGHEANPAGLGPPLDQDQWNPCPSKGAVAMQVMWMLVITLALAFSGVLGLALVSHANSRSRRR